MPLSLTAAPVKSDIAQVRSSVLTFNLLSEKSEKKIVTFVKKWNFFSLSKNKQLKIYSCAAELRAIMLSEQLGG